MGNKDRKSILRYHLVCRKTRPPQSGANTPAAFNAGNTSSDNPVTRFPVPSAAHLLLRFSLRSQLPELSVDALAVLLPRRWFVFDIHIKLQTCPFVKNFFPPAAE